MCGVLLAVAKTLVPACTNLRRRVRLAVSEAKSASAMSLSLEVTFSRATFKIAELVSSVLFSNAPSRPGSRRPVMATATMWLGCSGNAADQRKRCRR